MYIVDNVKFLSYFFVTLEDLVWLSMPCVSLVDSFCSIVFFILFFYLNSSQFLILSRVCNFYLLPSFPHQKLFSLLHELGAKCFEQKIIYFGPDEATA
jgi:hypothetical protein